MSIERKPQSNQLKTIERNRIIAIRLSNAIESQSNPKFWVKFDFVRFRSNSFDCVRICSIGFEFVRLIACSVTLVHRQSTRYDPLFRRILSPPQGLPALVRFSALKNRQIRHMRTTHITNHKYDWSSVKQYNYRNLSIIFTLCFMFINTSLPSY